MSESISNLYIFLSENEALIKNDVDKLISKGLFTQKDIITGDSILICISRDYYDLPNPTPAIMIRDSISNVFCPKWRINHVKYHALLPIMQYDSEDIPNVYVITENEEIYENMDYYLHLGKFGGRFKLLLPNTTFIPIKSKLSRDDVREQGILTAEILRMCGYDEENNIENPTKKVPGWVFQCASDWMTRILDLFDVYLTINEFPDLPNPYPKTRSEISTMLRFPIIQDGPRVGEDIRFCIIEDQETRFTLYELTVRALEIMEEKKSI